MATQSTGQSFGASARRPHVDPDREPGWRTAARPGNRPDFTKSFWFRTILVLSVLVLASAGLVLAWQPQAAGVVASIGMCGLALTAVIAAMASLRSRRSPDEQLRESP
jgi:hypothetical protein